MTCKKSRLCEALWLLGDRKGEYVRFGLFDKLFGFDRSKQKLNSVGCWAFDESHRYVECIGFVSATGLIFSVRAHVFFVFTDGYLLAIK